MATAGRTVLFSSLTVAAALAALTVFPQNFLHSMGIGGTLVALAAAAISLTVLPAVLALLGERVNSLSPRSCSAGPRRMRRKPPRLLVSPLTHGDALPRPDRGGERGVPDRAGDPVLQHRVHLGRRAGSTDASACQVDNVLRAEFPPYRDTPIQLAVEGDRATAEGVAESAAALEETAAVNPPQQVNDELWVVQVVSSIRCSTSRARTSWRRSVSFPPTRLRPDSTAGYVDLQDSLVEHLPLVLALVAVATFIVLFLKYRVGDPAAEAPG